MNWLAPRDRLGAAPFYPALSGPAGPDATLLMDLRPCYHGTGEQDEARLLFAMFARMGLRRFGGFASGTSYTSKRRTGATPFERTLEQTKVLIAQSTQRVHWPLGLDLVLPSRIRDRLFKPLLLAREGARREKLDLPLDPALFEDYFWQAMFEGTLPASERGIVRSAEYYAAELGHDLARSLCMLPRLFQRRLETEGWDVFFSPGLSPYRISAGTAMMIRYKDTLPLTGPHLVGGPWVAARAHSRMLARNMADGASFFCTSEPVRDGLLRLFPKAEARVHTLPPMLAPGYFRETVAPAHLAWLLSRYGGLDRYKKLAAGEIPTGDAAARRPETGGKALPILLRVFVAVAGDEPRSNFAKLFRAFEMAKLMTRTPVLLAIATQRGSRFEAETLALAPRARGAAVLLSGVPQAEMRALFNAAQAAIYPGREDGYNGTVMSALACGTPVIATHNALHRWMLGDAAAFCDAYDETRLAEMVARFAELPRDSGYLAELRANGIRQAALYTADRLAPRWEAAVRQESRMRV